MVNRQRRDRFQLAAMAMSEIQILDLPRFVAARLAALRFLLLAYSRWRPSSVKGV